MTKPDIHEPTEVPHWLDDPRHVRWLWWGFLVALSLTVAAQLFVHLPPHFAIESVFAFHAGFGFLACAAMILLARALAGALKRPESYYGDRDE